MTTAMRWLLVVVSALAVLSSTTFVMVYSGFKFINAPYLEFETMLSNPARYISHAAPWAPILTLVAAATGAWAAIRRSDVNVLAIASIAWLFAFSWALACLLAWEAPRTLIGT